MTLYQAIICLIINVVRASSQPPSIGSVLYRCGVSY